MCIRDRASSAFDMMDINGDGVLSREEFLLDGAFIGAFDAIDKNGDGVLTREEFLRGYALLTSDNDEAVAARSSIQRAVEAERMRAVQEVSTPPERVPERRSTHTSHARAER